MARSVNWRRIFLVLTIVLAVAGVGGAITAVLAYHEVTKIDRTNPKVVLDAYLRAALVEKDDVGVDLYTCDDPSGLDLVTKLRKELDERERQFGVTILVDWGSFEQQTAPGNNTLGADLVITGTKDGEVTSEREERWEFLLIEEDGWRVCGAATVVAPTSSPGPAPSVTQAKAQ